MTQARKAVTRADVARLAGVSDAVVSYTLNGGPKPVAAATAARVRDAVAKLGYTPNAAARALRRGTSDVLGLIIHDIANPFYGRTARAVEEAAAERGCDLIVASTAGRAGRALAHIRNLDARQVSGIIISVDLPQEALGEVARLQTPIVQVDATQPIGGAVRILPDLRGGTHLALEHLFALGHASVAFLGAESPADIRRRAWADAHRLSSRTPGPDEAVQYSRDGGYRGMQRILAESRPTAVFASSDMIGIGAMRAIREAGLVVPDDISVVSIDDTEEGQFAAPALTTVRQPVEEMAADAVAALLDPASAQPERTYDVRLVVRDSTAPPRAGRGGSER